MLSHVDVLVYHEKCSDGIASAWIVKNNAIVDVIIPNAAGKDLVGDYTNKLILFVDLCPSYANLVSLSEKNTVIVMDHHKSANDELSKYTLPYNVTFIYDVTKSGCQIVWDYFSKEKRPWFIDYIADRDLWTWKLENSKEITTALFYDNEFTFDGLDRLSKVTDYQYLVEKGKLIENFRQKDIQMASDNALVSKMVIKDNIYHVWIGNCAPHLRSDLGNVLANKLYNGRLLDFSVTWVYDIISGDWGISLRGREDSPDLSIISKFYGGGGHAKASGFVIKSGSLRDVFTDISK